MNKQETINSIVPTTQYLGSYVRKMITDIEQEPEAKNCPEFFKKGDVIRILAPKDKPRPSVIIKVLPDFVISIPLTTDSNIYCLSESKSRFFKDGCFTNHYEITPTDVAKVNFLGVYDNIKLLNEAIKQLRLFIVKNI